MRKPLSIESHIRGKEHQGFQELAAWLPGGWEEQARITGAFTRARKIRTPEDLFRIVVAYGVLPVSLPDLSRWVEQKDIAQISFPSLWERLEKCLEWLRWIVTQLLELQCGTLPPGLIWGPLDASTFSLPGSSKRDWLIHCLWSQGHPVQLHLSKCGGPGTGESLRHWESWPPQVIIIGDRAYGTPPGLAQTHEAGRQFLTRFVWNNLPLYEEAEGQTPSDPYERLASLEPGRTTQWFAWVRAQGKAPFRVRVIAIAKPADIAEEARSRARKEAKRKGRLPNPLSLFLNGYVLLASNVPPEVADTMTLVKAYRWRWQVELEFKRFKSTTTLRKFPNHKDGTVEVYLLAVLIAWLIACRIARESAFFPWGCPLGGGGRCRID